MCTLVLLLRPGHDWPLVLGANRDEMGDRPWLPPGRHWPDREDVVAGMDSLAGGTWLGVNDYGVFAGVLNRPESLGPREGFRSRGELPLEALDHADAADAAEAVGRIDPTAYRSFNLVVADNRDAFWLSAPDGARAVTVTAIPPGISMLTAHDLNERNSPRIRTYMPRFQKAAEPDPAAGDWKAWQQLFQSRLYDPEDGPRGAMTIVTKQGFGTVSSSLIALPAVENEDAKPVWLFAAGRPGEVPWVPVDLG
jgi:uncharacterized protein with NRDE domain